jgi:hypothetical protein
MLERQVGASRDFVLAKSFMQAGSHAGLLGEDDSKRLFAELFADPDHPEVRLQEAWQAILTSMQPGWTLRLLQLFWPDRAAPGLSTTGAGMDDPGGGGLGYSSARIDFGNPGIPVAICTADGSGICSAGRGGDSVAGGPDGFVRRVWVEGKLSGTGRIGGAHPLGAESESGIRWMRNSGKISIPRNHILPFI